MAKKATTTEKVSAAEKVQESTVRVIGKIENIVSSIPNVKEFLDAIVTEVEFIKSDLTLGMKEFEVSLEAKKKALEETYQAKELELKANLDLNTSKAVEVTKKYNDDIADLKAKLDKEKEELVYNAKLAVERTNEDTANKIAEKVGKILVVKTEYDSTVSKANDNQRKSEEEVKEIANKAKSEVYATEGSKLKDLQNQTSSQIALLSKELELANSQVASYKQEITYFKEQLAKVPLQIKEAVEAAKTVVNTNVSTDKK